MAQDQRERERERRRGKEESETEIETQRTCLPCSLGDSALASLQFTCTGLPNAASQAIVPKLDSHWVGGAPLAPQAAQQRFIGLARASSWRSTSDWLKSTVLLYKGFAVAETLSMDT